MILATSELQRQRAKIHDYLRQKRGSKPKLVWINNPDKDQLRHVGYQVNFREQVAVANIIGDDGLFFVKYSQCHVRKFKDGLSSAEIAFILGESFVGIYRSPTFDEAVAYRLTKI